MDRRAFLAAALGKLMRQAESADTAPGERRLAAILTADISGDSQLARVDDDGTVATADH